MTDDYLSRIEDMIDEKPRPHPLWALIDRWGGQMYLKSSQLTLWKVEP